jgi:hypothetical protein
MELRQDAVVVVQEVGVHRSRHEVVGRLSGRRGDVQGAAHLVEERGLQPL